jgi:hypothetical protein
MVVVVAAQSPMRPGRWETTIEMQMANMKMPGNKTNRCVTAEDIKKNAQSILPSSVQPGQPDPCKVSDYLVKGQTVTWKVACTGQEAMSGTGEMTFKSDTFDGLMKMTHPQMGELTMKMTGKRTGDCTK